MSQTASAGHVAGRHRAPATQADAARVTPVTGRSGRWAQRLVAAVLSLGVLVGLLAFLFLAVGPHLLGYRTATMLTGSMEPGIAPGDVVVTVPVPVEDVDVGDVVSYHIPIEDHRVETHRVTEVLRDNGSIAIRTKGDANAGVDPWTATLEGDTIHEVRAVVPAIGGWIRALRTPAVRGVVQWGALGGLVVSGLLLIWSKGDEDEDGVPVADAARPAAEGAADVPVEVVDTAPAPAFAAAATAAAAARAATAGVRGDVRVKRGRHRSDDDLGAVS